MRTVLSLLCLFVLGADLGAQGLVSRREDRLTLLQALERIMAPQDEGFLATLAERENPFAAPVVESAVASTPASQTPSGPRPSEPPPPPVRLPDRVALEAVTASFNPTGSLIGSDTAYLNFSNGRRMQLGESFRATIRGEQYLVTLEEVTAEGFTLRLGDSRLTRQFQNISRSDGTIRRSPITTEDSPPPLVGASD